MRTEDIDQAPCINKNHPFVPQKVTTIHKSVRDPKTNLITLLCTGKTPRPGSVFLGGSLGISCIECRTKMKEAAIARDAKLYGPEAVSPSNPTPENGENLSLPGDTGNAEIDIALDDSKE